MVELYDEIKEEVTAEKLHSLWNRYKQIIIGTLVVFVIVIAGINGWDYYQGTQKKAVGDKLFQAHLANQSLETEKALSIYNEIIAETGDTFFGKDIAFLRSAAIHAQNNDIEKVLLTYKEAVENSAVSDEIRHLAAVLYSYNVLGMTSPKEAQLQQVDQWLNSLLKETNVWQYSVMELNALYNVKMGKVAEAQALLQTIESEDKAPASLKKRIRALLTTFLEQASNQ